MKKSQKVSDMDKDTRSTHYFLTRCCAKPEKGMPGSDDQEWASRFATNLK